MTSSCLMVTPLAIHPQAPADHFGSGPQGLAQSGPAPNAS